MPSWLALPLDPPLDVDVDPLDTELDLRLLEVVDEVVAVLEVAAAAPPLG